MVLAVIYMMDWKGTWGKETRKEAIVVKNIYIFKKLKVTSKIQYGSKVILKVIKKYSMVGKSFEVGTD